MLVSGRTRAFEVKKRLFYGGFTFVLVTHDAWASSIALGLAELGRNLFSYL